MKIIMSRKGFDTSNGGLPSPILPDGTLLSMPIPSPYGRPYSEMYHNGINYAHILSSLGYRGNMVTGHLDPDIRPNVMSSKIKSWKPLLGQVSSSQGVLRNRNVGVGDLFLFFGCFQEVDSMFRYQPNTIPKHIIFGYLEIADVVIDPSAIKEYSWHPHADMTGIVNNTIYIAANRLSLNPDLPGAGVLDYREDQVLTKENNKWYVWDENKLPFLTQEHLCKSVRRYNPSDGGIVIADKTGQEFVYNESDELCNWARSLVNA
ncbi:MAG: hypothetical protein PHI27_06035 [Eubacteriales bacterium]|nr:hypothetical protein [Eubacteriales bacterium]MDD4513584.1 hypothetical protein [Eubacteriales bacterium]